MIDDDISLCALIAEFLGDQDFRVSVAYDGQTGLAAAFKGEYDLILLAIAKRAVEVHHGQIWAENAEPGLRVVAELPLSLPPSAVAQSSNAVRASSQEFDRQKAQLPN